ncbi:MAG TPA: hypothetical protein VKD90_04850 [Gemmataceae bacterium]|nr:hypothetical protein [Gemmataceae bacterium]
MIADTNKWAAMAKRVTALGGWDRGRRWGADPGAVRYALRVLIWLAGERTTIPRLASARAAGTILLGWAHDGGRFEVEVFGDGQLRWQAEDADGSGWSGKRLSGQAAELLKSHFPLAR